MLPTMSAYARAGPDVPHLAPIHSSGVSFRENFSESLHSSSTWANSTTAAAQSLSHVRLLQPDGLYSPPGSSVHGDSPGKNAGVACHALLFLRTQKSVFYCLPTPSLCPSDSYQLPCIIADTQCRRKSDANLLMAQTKCTLHC